MIFERKINTSKIDVSCKLNAKISCLEACNYDVDKADKLYKFLTNDLKNLPENEIHTSKFTKFKNEVSDGIGFIKENREDIFSFIEFIKGLRGSKNVAAIDIPEIPKP